MFFEVPGPLFGDKNRYKMALDCILPLEQLLKRLERILIALGGLLDRLEGISSALEAILIENVAPMHTGRCAADCIRFAVPADPTLWTLNSSPAVWILEPWGAIGEPLGALGSSLGTSWALLGVSWALGGLLDQSLRAFGAIWKAI